MRRFLYLLIFLGLISCTYNFDVSLLVVNTLPAGAYQNSNITPPFDIRTEKHLYLYDKKVFPADENIRRVITDYRMERI